MKKRILSLLTTLVMVVGLASTAFSVGAVDTTETIQGSESAIENDVNIKGSNDFGIMLADTISEEQSEQQANNGYNVFSVEMIDNTAVVEFETLEDCTLLVGIYDESGEAMLASGSLEVYTGETDAYVDIETDSMPEYFYLRAFLIDTYSFRPLCTAYESPNYTQEMQEFFAKTVDDFDKNKVLNLDDSEDNNFAVYGDDTTVVKQASGKNVVASADEENNKYVIKNADSSIMSLKSGDVFSYEYSNGDVLIVKVKSISISGTTVTITGQDAEMDDAFDYVKIDTKAGTADATVDASNLEDGITYNGLVESPDDEIQTYGIDVGGSVDLLAYEYKIKDKKIGAAKVSGSVQLKTTATAKVYVSWNYQYIELKLDYSAKASFSLSGEGKGSMPLAYMCFLPIPGLIIEVTPSVVLETNVTAEVSGTLKGAVGFKASNTEGMVDLTKSPTFTSEFKIEGTVFVGLSLEPKVKIISDYLAKATLSAKAGVEIKGTLTKSSEDNSSANKIHECKNCIDGDIKAKLTVSFEAKLLNWDSLTFKINLIDLSVNICDFYFSYDFAEFDFTTCPHLKYKTTISLYDKDLKTVSGATVKIDGNEYKTDDSGKVSMYLPNGSYTVNASKTGVGSAQSQITVSDNAVKKSINLSNSSSSGGSAGGDVGSNLPYEEIAARDTVNKYWVIFHEGYRNGRLEMSSFDSNGDFKVVWNRNLVCDNLLNKCTQYYYDEAEKAFKVIGTYRRLTDYAIDIVGSNVDIYSKEGDLLFKATSVTSDPEVNITYIDQVALSLPTKTTIPARAASNTKAFTSLQKNEIYNIYALKSQSAGDKLMAKNLLYITQSVTDDSGKLSIAYDLTESCDNPTWLAVPMHGIDISGANVTVSNLEYNGKEQYVEPVVKLGTKTLTEGVDYYLEKDYSVTDPSEYTIIVTGMGEYSGSVAVSYSVEKAYLLGDINLDGKISTADVGLANAHAKNTKLLNDEQFKRADINKDGKVSTADVGLINAYAKGTKKYA